MKEILVPATITDKFMSARLLVKAIVEPSTRLYLTGALRVKLPLPSTRRLLNEGGPEAEAECVLNSVTRCAEVSHRPGVGAPRRLTISEVPALCSDW
jgi:hypothetical protein